MVADKTPRREAGEHRNALARLQLASYFLIAFPWALLLSVKRASAIGLSGLWVHTLQRGLPVGGAECMPLWIPA